MFVVEKTAAVTPVAETTPTPGIRHVIFLVYRLSMIRVHGKPANGVTVFNLKFGTKCIISP